MTRILIATESDVLVIDGELGTIIKARGLTDRPTCLAADALTPAGAWCGTRRNGVFRSDDAGNSWRAVGLEGQYVMSLAVSPAARDLVWIGTEPSAVWRSTDNGETWEATRPLEELPSSNTWSFPPRPDTHHVRWIACDPRDADRLWVAIEAGALVSTHDGGRTWRDRVPGGPRDTHELAIHPALPNVLRGAAGDGYFESYDGGATWTSPREGLEVGYLRSVAIDPGDPHSLVVSASRSPYSAYIAGRGDGRLYRRVRLGRWERVGTGWPDPPNTIAPLLAAGVRKGELWAADERGIHRSLDGSVTWQMIANFPTRPKHLRGIAIFS